MNEIPSYLRLSASELERRAYIEDWKLVGGLRIATIFNQQSSFSPIINLESVPNADNYGLEEEILESTKKVGEYHLGDIPNLLETNKVLFRKVTYLKEELLKIYTNYGIESSEAKKVIDAI